MTATFTRIAIATLTVAALAGAARAEYRCEPAGTTIDRKACEAARQGPDELRRYVLVTKPIRSDLQASDYVDRKTVEAWDARARQQASQDSERPARSQVARDARR
jgi:hypothetical protein